jgi:2,3-bisphosphoglycerate-independent phosphoglycerate mutase
MKKLCLIIIDGFGVAPAKKGNAREEAAMPTIRQLEAECPSVIMQASGNAVGLPEGQQGASEPGHLTIGAGRVVWQPLEEISRAVRLGDFFKNPVLCDACDRAKRDGVTLHLIGLYSSGGVHSAIDHFHAALKLAKERGVEKVSIHLFSDGRDVPEQHFCADFNLLTEEVSKLQLGTIASLVGRFYAMDRDRQYKDRTKVAYDLLTAGVGDKEDDLCAGAKRWYLEAKDKEKTDYYIRPLKTSQFKPIAADDVVLCINFRSDRMIQIVRALEAEDFNEFPRPVRVRDVVCMGPYSDHLPVAFPPQAVPNTLGQVVSKAGLKQLRLAETDKFAHVTFFFNAQVHEPYPGEDRVLVESPKVTNYAETPAMSAEKLSDELTKAAEKGEHQFIVINYANPDLVGHGGKPEAAVQACEAVDKNLARILPVLERCGYEWIITADHGNAEQMYYPGTHTVCPSHTTNPVQTFVHSAAFPDSASLKKCTGLKDIAPICLTALGIPVPGEMR